MTTLREPRTRPAPTPVQEVDLRRSFLQQHLGKIILAGVVVAALIGGLTGALIVASRPSDADLLARAVAGNKEAGAKLEAKYATPVPQPIKSATFTPGIYTNGSIPQGLSECQQDAGRVVACQLFFAYQGNINKAEKLYHKSLGGAQGAREILGMDLHNTKQAGDAERANGTFPTLVGLETKFLLDEKGEGSWRPGTALYTNRPYAVKFEYTLAGGQKESGKVDVVIDEGKWWIGIPVKP